MTASAVWAGLVLRTTALAPAAFMAAIWVVRLSAVSVTDLSTRVRFHCWAAKVLPSRALEPKSPSTWTWPMVSPSAMAPVRLRWSRPFMTSMS